MKHDQSEAEALANKRSILGPVGYVKHNQSEAQAIGRTTNERSIFFLSMEVGRRRSRVCESEAVAGDLPEISLLAKKEHLREDLLLVGRVESDLTLARDQHCCLLAFCKKGRRTEDKLECAHGIHTTEASLDGHSENIGLEKHHFTHSTVWLAAPFISANRCIKLAQFGSQKIKIPPGRTRDNM